MQIGCFVYQYAKLRMLSISSVLFFEEPGCPLVVGSMFGGVVTGKPVVLL
jgi:hypothetical protein